ncbi:MAG: hypothetical protein QXN34_01135 [Archaeoglobaceae archaeon]
MEAEKIAKVLNASKAFVSGKNPSLFRIQKDLAEELQKLFETLIPGEEFTGYAIVNGESLVFHKKGGKMIVAFVDEDKIFGAFRKMMEYE